MLKPSIIEKLEALSDRYEELEALLGDAQVIADQKQFRALSKEYADLEDSVKPYRQYKVALEDFEAAKTLADDDDPDMRAMAKDEIDAAQNTMTELESVLEMALLPKDPNDSCSVFLEVRAGTGGDEAAIFSGDLYKMYARYADNQNWQIEVLSERPGEHGGYKEIITHISGKGVYGQLKFESGAHRVQRVPETETQGRIHTSACTVAVMPEQDDVEEIEINKADLRIDTFRASGAGGQHVNKTDSAIRITHLPTGVVVECQDERSQHKNKARAMSLLQARLMDSAVAEQKQQESDQRRNLVGSGDRSERIRTYNYPQGRVTDHRINLTLYKLDEVMTGELGAVVDPLVREHQADLLAAMSSNE